MRRAVSSATPSASSARRYASAADRANANSCASDPPALWITRPSAAASLPRKPARASAARRRAKCGACSFQGRVATPAIGIRAERIVPKPDVRRRQRKCQSSRQHRVDDRDGTSAKDRLRYRCRHRDQTPSSTRSSAASRRRQAEAMIAARTGEHERKTGRAVAEFTQRNFVGERRIGMIDPRQYLPRSSHRDGP